MQSMEAGHVPCHAVDLQGEVGCDLDELCER